MINQKTWAVSSVVGSVLQVLGLVPFVLWMLDYVDVIRKGQDPTHWGIIIVSAALFGFGTILVKGKGDSIADVVLGLLKKE